MEACRIPKVGAMSDAEYKPHASYVKADMVEFGCNCKSEKKCHGDELGPLQRDLATTYRWSGRCCSDYLFFICNWHPLLGMVLSHPAHPWSKAERFGAFVFGFALSLLPLSVSQYNKYKAESHSTDKTKEVRFLVILVVSVIVMIWEVALYWISIIDMYCVGRCNICVRIVRCFKYCCMSVSLFAAGFMAFISCYIMSYTDIPLAQLFIAAFMSLVQRWVLWFPIWTFLPCFGFLPVFMSEGKAARKQSGSGTPAPATPASQKVGQPAVAVVVSRSRCEYGQGCTRTSQDHKLECSHPGDPDWESGRRSHCQYGSGCTRKNPEHKEEFSHPGDGDWDFSV